MFCCIFSVYLLYSSNTGILRSINLPRHSSLFWIHVIGKLKIFPLQRCSTIENPSVRLKARISFRMRHCEK